MKSISVRSILILPILILMLGSCSKNSGTNNPSVTIPVLTTASVSAITQTTATAGGNVTSAGNGTVTARGVVWGLTANPTISDSKTVDGTGTGTFSSSVTGLTANTTYHLRAYATNSAGTAYGSDMIFTTLSSSGVSIPSLTTTAISAITATTATGGGSVTSDGGGTVLARGVVWSTSANPTISDSKTIDGTGTGSFVSSLTGLTGGTTYHVRAYATNSAGTGYGSDVSFTTTSAGPNTVNITIIGFAFSPSTVTVHVGDIIKWTNNDGTTHTATSDAAQPFSFNSGNLSGSGGTFSYTTTTTGTTTYHCAIHPSMTGTIIVQP
jgi:plastocyanin